MPLKKNCVPKVCAIHDLAGFGRCSFSVVLPVLCAMGVQPCALPTAIFSTHTGGFEGFSFFDFTEYMEGYYRHWKELGIQFDAIYSGFLGSKKQIRIVSNIIDAFKTEKSIVFVDPVMGDDGVLYSTYNNEMQNGMKELVKKADVISPNVTEAAFLLEEPCKSEYSEKELHNIMERLSEMGPGRVAVTGIPYKNEVLTGFFERNSKSGIISQKKIEKSYPGTGDIFASVLLGGLLRKFSFEKACRTACFFVGELIEYSSGFDYETREGVLLEALLHKLSEKINNTI